MKTKVHNKPDFATEARIARMSPAQAARFEAQQEYRAEIRQQVRDATRQAPKAPSTRTRIRVTVPHAHG